MGKTTLLINLALQDIHRGRGLALLDPDGAVAEDVLNHIPTQRTNDVVYFNPADAARPIGINLVDTVPPDARPAVAEHTLSAIKSIYKDTWGIQLERILRNALRVQLDNAEGTILGIQKMLTHRRYRQSVTKHATDPVVHSFWNDFERWDKGDQQQAVRSVLNRLEQFLENPLLRNILAQVHSSIDFESLVATNKIFIANLSTRHLGDEPSHLLGSLLITKFKTAVAQKLINSNSFSVLIDQCHLFAPAPLVSLLSASTPCRLAITTQYIDQLHEEARHAVLANAGTIVSFRVGNTDDAELLVKTFTSKKYKAEDFLDLDQHAMLVKHMRSGVYTEPIEGRGLPHLAEIEPSYYCGRKETIVKQSRKRYGGRRSVIERKVKSFMGR